MFKEGMIKVNFMAKFTQIFCSVRIVNDQTNKTELVVYYFYLNFEGTTFAIYNVLALLGNSKFKPFYPD